MDYATRLAYRSLVRVLIHGEHLKKGAAAEVVASLMDAIVKADADGKRGAVVQLEELRAGIASDFGLSLRD